MEGNHHKRFAKESSERIEALSLQVQPGFSTVNSVKPVKGACIEEMLFSKILLINARCLAQTRTIG
jgi:hypothetical protein